MCILLHVVSRFPSVLVFVIILPVDEVFLTILGHLMVYNPLDCVKGGHFILWYVSLMLRIILVVFEHVWSEDWVMRVASVDVESEVDMFIDGGNLVWAAPDGLQFLSKVLLKESSLVHD